MVKDGKLGYEVDVDWWIVWGFGNEEGGCTVEEGVVLSGCTKCLECGNLVVLGERVAKIEEDDGRVSYVHVACLPSEVVRAREMAMGLLVAN